MNELAKALRSIDENDTGYAKMMWDAADVIDELEAELSGLRIFYQNISKLPDCNTCFKKDMCEFTPRYGAYARINCPHWLGEPPKEE